MKLGGPPPFHDLGEYVFEDLCCELLEEQESIVALRERPGSL
jgi:hypothetical protein